MGKMGMQQADDFLSESRCLEELLGSLQNQDYEMKTHFKSWTISDILRHLHLFNEAADLTLRDEVLFQKVFGERRIFTH